MLTMDEIRQHTYETTLKKGRSYHLMGMVEDMTVVNAEIGTRGNTRASAIVSGSGYEDYNAYLVVNSEGKIMDYDCTCPAAENYWGMCKHCVAVALELQKRQSRSNPATGPAAAARQPAAKTSIAIRNLLNQYAPQALPDPAMHPKGEIELECYFRRMDTGFRMECKIGKKQMYVVKDIPKLVVDVNQKNHVKYGVNLEFTHSFDAFTPNGKSIFRLLENVIMTQPDQYSSYYSPYSRDKRYLDLYHDDLEQFILHYLGRHINLDDQKVMVADANPEVILSMHQCAGGASIAGEIMDIYKGSQSLFIYKDSTLWRCTEEFSNAVLPLLEAIHIPEYQSHRKPALYLSEGDFTAFCRDLLPVVSPHVKVETRDIDLKAYAPIDPEFYLYLRMPKEDRIELTGSVRYGSQEFDLLMDTSITLPIRDIRKESEMKALLEKYFTHGTDAPLSRLNISQEMYPVVAGQYQSMDPDPDDQDMESYTESFSGAGTCWEAVGDDAIYNLLSAGLPELSRVSAVFVDSTIRRLTVGMPPQVTVGVGYSGDLLNLDISVAGMDPREVNQVLSSYRMKKKYYRLKTGDFISLGEDSLSTLAELTDGLRLTPQELAAGHALLPAYRALYVDNVLGESQDALVKKNQDFRRLVENVRDYSAGDVPVPQGLQAQMRKYQQEGYQWLCSLYDCGFGGILADDMGLGKTLQVIALMAHAVETQQSFSALVVCPASLVYNWESEIKKFAPGLSVQIIAGKATQRRAMLAQSKHYHVSIASYDLLKRYIDDYSDCTFDLCILDEAQYIKNATTQVAKAAKAVSCRHRFALTGTPIENRLSDLWSIFDFLMPGYLYTYARFKQEIETPVIKNADETATKRLKKMVSPFLLRRRKADVLKDLPDKLEEEIYVSMTPEQQKLYTAHLSRIRNEYQSKNDQELQTSKIQILAEITRLRQLCCAPGLCYEDYTGGSGKMDAILELLENAVDSGHRVLVFSQFTSLLEMLIKQWTKQHPDYLYLSGKDSKLHRQEMVQKFQTGNIPVFFISLKAGGTGLNLTAADMVIHCDPWWNVAAQNQATDRAHRIGQKSIVNVMKIVAKDSIEERIINLQNKKANLSDSVIEGDGVSNFRLDKETLNELFR